jgi:hypothetical protein
MDNPKIQATLDIRHRTKTNKAKINTENYEISNTNPSTIILKY